MDAPIVYRIEVEGWLSEDWSEWLGGLSFSQEMAPGNVPVTIMRGRVADQAALHGILSAIRDLALPIVSIRRSAA